MFNTSVPASTACEQLLLVNYVFSAKQNWLSEFENSSCVMSKINSSLASKASASEPPTVVGCQHCCSRHANLEYVSYYPTSIEYPICL